MHLPKFVSLFKIHLSVNSSFSPQTSTARNCISNDYLCHLYTMLMYSIAGARIYRDHTRNLKIRFCFFWWLDEFSSADTTVRDRNYLLSHVCSSCIIFLQLLRFYIFDGWFAKISDLLDSDPLFETDLNKKWKPYSRLAHLMNGKYWFLSGIWNYWKEIASFLVPFTVIMILFSRRYKSLMR